MTTEDIFLAITKEYLDNYLVDYIEKNYHIEDLMDFLNDKDITTIRSFYEKVIEGDYKSQYVAEFSSLKALIMISISDFVKEFGQVNIEGYITFRMKGHLEHLNLITDYVIDETMIDKTIDGVVKILKLSYENTYPLYEEFHIAKVNDEYVITNEHGDDITKEAYDLDGEVYDIIPIVDEISAEDLLMAAIVVGAPTTVYFKDFESIDDIFFKKELMKLLNKNLILE